MSLRFFHKFFLPQFSYFPHNRLPQVAVSKFSTYVENGKSGKNRELPESADVVIFGGGSMGSSAAFWLKKRAPDTHVTVVERDLQYKTASTPLSCGGIRQQFSEPENVQLSLFSVDFIKNIQKYCTVDTSPDISFVPNGYLVLASDAGVETLVENHKTQKRLGAFVELYDPEQLKAKFPWLNTNGIALGSFGNQNEGWFDPYSLLIALKKKAESLGVRYINAELIGFDVTNESSSTVDSNSPISCNQAFIRLPNGVEKQVYFNFGIITSGYNSGQVSNLLHSGRYHCPVEPRKRYVYVLHCPDGPGLSCPLVIDHSGVYCRREGLGGNYICGKSPAENEEPDVSDLEVDYSYFEDVVWPTLAHRIPCFENSKVKSAWAGYYDYNVLDQNAIIGKDPHFRNFIWATGFSGHGIQMSPAVGLAVSELLLDGRYKTVDLTRLGWERVVKNIKVEEKCIF